MSLERAIPIRERGEVSVEARSAPNDFRPGDPLCTCECRLPAGIASLRTRWPRCHHHVVSISRRALLASGVSAPLLGGGCGAAAPAVGPALSNPATQTFLVSVATSLGASAIEDVLKEGAKGLEKWYGPTQEWITKWNRKKKSYYYHEVFKSEASPAFLLVRTSLDANGNPLKDEVGVILNYGAEAVRLPAWAWQTLIMFSEAFLQGRDGANEAQARALMVAALAPTTSKVAKHATPAGAIATVSYQTKLGPVDLAKVEESDHSYSGVIKVSGIPDEALESIVSHYPLPTRVAD